MPVRQFVTSRVVRPQPLDVLRLPLGQVRVPVDDLRDRALVKAPAAAAPAALAFTVYEADLAERLPGPVARAERAIGQIPGFPHLILVYVAVHLFDRTIGQLLLKRGNLCPQLHHLNPVGLLLPLAE